MYMNLYIHISDENLDIDICTNILFSIKWFSDNLETFEII